MKMKYYHANSYVFLGSIFFKTKILQASHW